jgi:hypothetical protein
MKKFLLISFLLVSVVVVNAQEDPLFVKGDKIVNAGIGLGYYRSYSSALDFSASLDYCIADGIIDEGSVGVGPFAGLGLYVGGIQPYGGFRGTFHYPLIEKLDTYIGFGMGVRLYSSLHLIGGGFIGANYPITEKITIFGELGSGSTCAGIAFRLK